VERRKIPISEVLHMSLRKAALRAAAKTTSYYESGHATPHDVIQNANKYLEWLMRGYKTKAEDR
jgi:hypothetical protein